MESDVGEVVPAEPQPRPNRALIEKAGLQMLLIAMVIQIVAFIWTWQIGLKANFYEHKLFHLQMNLEDLKKEVGDMEKELKS